MALYAWSYLKFAAGGQGAILALLNSAVHVVMYTYYFLSGLGPRFQKYLWWKKYVTKMQLVQFMLMLAYCVWTHLTPRCQFANNFTYFICTNVSIFLLLFLNFYSKSYVSANKTPEQQIKEAFEKGKSGIAVNSRNGLCKGGANKLPNEMVDEKSYEMDLSYCNDNANSEVFITRRSTKAAYASECEFSDVLKK
ncbi:Elongation of very long chain fatty acids protein 7 [Eumeta japonica]|uniref:Elongation of very long chain fatty acids protein n=1 Tax=Eumeta variegata TaxID=151549 RepID=A0A4C1YTG0_EUMVA|nr:Elongation of very long chain fatty acids protein 7 [Eumeta japonica]